MEKAMLVTKKLVCAALCLALVLLAGCSGQSDGEREALVAQIADLESQIAALQEQADAAARRMSERERQVRDLQDEKQALLTQIDGYLRRGAQTEAPDGQAVFHSVLSMAHIGFQTSETDYIAIGQTFMELFGTHWRVASLYYPQSPYAISDYMPVDVTLHSALSAQPYQAQNGTVFTVQCDYAFLPPVPLGDGSPLWAGNTAEYSGKEGWYIQSLVVRLLLDTEGHVSLVSAGTGI